jgi:hypothetical protein
MQETLKRLIESEEVASISPPDMNEKHMVRKAYKLDPDTVPIGLVSNVLSWVRDYCSYNEIKISEDDMMDLFESIRQIYEIVSSVRAEYDDIHES